MSASQRILVGALTVLLTQALTRSVAWSEEYPTLPIGADAPKFHLPGIDGKQHQLAEYDQSKLLLVLFTCNHCPTAQAYEERIKQLYRDYRDHVALVAISPNDPEAVRLDELGYSDLGDSLEDMKLRAEEADFAFPYLYDGETQSVSQAYGAKATPHAFLFDSDRKLRYTGRIDDGEVDEPTSHDLRAAIDALLAGKAVPTSTTRVFGCSVKWAAKRSGSQEAVEKWEQEPVELKEIDLAAIKKLVANPTDNYRLINLWATWCGPCVTEMPILVDINRMYRRRNFELITISLDAPRERDAALKLLKEAHASTTNYISTVTDTDKFAEAFDADWPGPVPYTVLIAPGGKIIYRTDQEIEPLTLRRKIVDALGRTYASRKLN